MQSAETNRCRQPLISDEQLPKPSLASSKCSCRHSIVTAALVPRRLLTRFGLDPSSPGKGRQPISRLQPITTEASDWTGSTLGQAIRPERLRRLRLAMLGADRITDALAMGPKCHLAQGASSPAPQHCDRAGRESPGVSHTATGSSAIASSPGIASTSYGKPKALRSR
jgi:hypothetical protein